MKFTKRSTLEGRIEIDIDEETYARVLRGKNLEIVQGGDMGRKDSVILNREELRELVRILDEEV